MSFPRPILEAILTAKQNCSTYHNQIALGTTVPWFPWGWLAWLGDVQFLYKDRRNGAWLFPSLPVWVLGTLAECDCALLRLTILFEGKGAECLSMMQTSRVRVQLRLRATVSSWIIHELMSCSSAQATDCWGQLLQFHTNQHHFLAYLDLSWSSETPMQQRNSRAWLLPS